VFIVLNLHLRTSFESMAAALKAEIDAQVALLADKKKAQEALEVLAKIASEKGAVAAPFLVPEAFQKINEAIGDKSKAVKDAAVNASKVIIDVISPFAIDIIMPTLLAGISVKAKPPQKEATLNLITAFVAKAPEAVGYELVSLVGPVADLTCDIKKEVKVAAIECMQAISGCTGNKDLEPFLPAVVEAASSIQNTHKCVEKLAGCVFVQNVETKALAVMLPVLQRGLTDKAEEVKRTCCQIVDNMCKVVEDPASLIPVMPILEPLVKGATEKISDPEARGVAEKALATLQKAFAGAESQRVDVNAAVQALKEAIGDKAGNDNAFEITLMHTGALAAMATNMMNFEEEKWNKAVALDKPFTDVIDEVRAKMLIAAKPAEEIEEEDTEGVDLYKGSFSLAYGTLTLLRDTKMHLKRDRFYGLLGPNQCGKTTLMRAIAREQLEGFPKRDELKSVFVEHEIEDEEVDVQDDGFPILSVDKPGWWWVQHTCNEIYQIENKVSEETVKELMKSLGFGYPGGPDRAANLENPVTSYSGGWKMKMQLCAAQLMNADVLMLDEPTGHLDVDNIKWLEDWLESFPGSIICTSHFSPFLDRMCTHIIDFQDRKLKTFKGVKGKCLTQFVEKHPEKKAYFELSNEVMKFVFPEPGSMEGVKSRSKVVLRMNNVTFQYPTKDKPTIMDVSLTVSQVSRVAVIGANGAGKSTAIKVLVGEQKPTEGTIWKASGLRMAYVAQHAFHHLEKHMQKTPTEYIMWRFAGNDDKESLEFKTQELSVDEEQARSQKWCIDGVTGAVRRCIDPKEDAKKAKQDEEKAVIPDAILNRRMKKKEKTYEYEVKWQMQSIDQSCWVEKDIMIKMGYLKMVQREDEKQAAMAGLQSKQLTQPGIEKHLKDFGVDPEFASHTQINQLSGGMKVKVVLACCMWQNPHILILDEPTNYLDREGLGALVLACKDYKGGVLIISHNKEFCDNVATEKWIMKGGYLRIEGESKAADDEIAGSGNKEAAEVFDGAGNKIDVKLQQSLSAKDTKKAIKDLEKKLKDGKKNKTLSEDEIYEIEDKLLELKSQ
jgi:elongation factor 3